MNCSQREGGSSSRGRWRRRAKRLLPLLAAAGAPSSAGRGVGAWVWGLPCFCKAAVSPLSPSLSLLLRPRPRKEMAGKAASASASAAGPSSPASSFSAGAIGEELRCPICYEPFREAATLCCGHNFCKGCVSRSWQAQARPVCPVCKAACAPEELRTNYALANIVEMFLRQQRDEERKRREGGGDGGARAVCPRHGEEAKLFCLDDRELVCVVCQSSKQHAEHRLKPLADMAENYRAKCKDMENSLRDKIKEFESMQSDYRLIMNHNKAESDRLEKEMKKQFEQLHRFLQNEEKTMLEELREETQKKQDLIKEKIKKLSEESDALLQEVGQLQVDLKDDDISFLKKHKNRKRRIAWTVEQPEPIPAGTLIEVTKHLDSLQYNVWKKMRDLIKVVPFSFDPNTATGWLEVSDDLTSISTCKYRLMVEVPERFSIGKPCVLGSKGFSKGSHTWEVDVSGTDCWYTGVARKSCGYYWSFGCDFRLGLEYMYRVESAKNEKSQSSQVILPETGHKKGIKKLRVELDCEEGELSFYNAEWNRHIYTFHDKFGEVFPYFSMYSSDITKESPPETFKICPLRVLIKEEYPN